MEKNNEYYRRYRKSVMFDEESALILKEARNYSRLVREAVKIVREQAKQNNVLYIRLFK